MRYLAILAAWKLPIIGVLCYLEAQFELRSLLKCWKVATQMMWWVVGTMLVSRDLFTRLWTKLGNDGETTASLPYKILFPWSSGLFRQGEAEKWSSPSPWSKKQWQPYTHVLIFLSQSYRHGSFLHRPGWTWDNHLRNSLHKKMLSFYLRWWFLLVHKLMRLRHGFVE